MGLELLVDDTSYVRCLEHITMYVKRVLPTALSIRPMPFNDKKRIPELGLRCLPVEDGVTSAPHIVAPPRWCARAA